MQVGNGRRVFFWKHKWINGNIVADLAPDVLALVPTTRQNRRMVDSTLQRNEWLLDLAGNMTEEGKLQCVSLWLQIGRLDSPTDEDKFSWIRGRDGKYSARNTYMILCKGRIISNIAKPIWSSHAPFKCKILSWLAGRHRLWTSDQRARHGLLDQAEPCFTCFAE
jgi:hypothetical protein